MTYCTKCGAKIPDNSKFCPNCGAIIIQNNQKNVPPPPKRSMQKGVIKSLENDVKNILKSKIDESVKNENTTEKLSENIDFPNDTNESLQKHHSRNIWLVLYFIFAFLLAYLFNHQDEIMGMTFFTFVILIAYLIRRKKEKPFNILLKVILILQGILVFSLIMTNLQLAEDSLLQNILLIPFILTIIMLLIKGNKK